MRIQNFIFYGNKLLSNSKEAISFMCNTSDNSHTLQIGYSSYSRYILLYRNMHLHRRIFYISKTYICRIHEPTTTTSGLQTEAPYHLFHTETSEAFMPTSRWGYLMKCSSHLY